MRKLWNILGRIGFWGSWPLLWIYLRFGKRTRVVVASGDQILLVKGWLGSGQWLLPGGGLHRSEDPVQGAVREVREETGITLAAERLHVLHERLSADNGLRFRYVAYAVTLPAPVEPTRQRFELSDVRWAPVNDVLSGGLNVNHTTREILRAWQDKR